MLGYKKEYSWEIWSTSQLESECEAMKHGPEFSGLFSIEVHDHLPDGKVQIFVGRLARTYQPLNVEVYR